MNDDTQTKAEREAKLRSAYALATKNLREKYKAEFLQMQAAAAAKIGVEWTPRKSAEERAKEQMEKLFNDYPHLREWAQAREVLNHTVSP